MNKVIPTYEQFITEGRYDQLTGLITKEIFKTIKIAHSLHNLGVLKDLGELDANGFNDIQLEVNGGTQIDTDVFLKIKFTEGLSDKFAIDGTAWNTMDDISAIEIELNLDPNHIPKIYSKLNGFIQDAVRHEIEHLTQAGHNKKPFRPVPTRAKTRNKISFDFGNAYKYFILRDEIPAMVHGMYRKTKVEKVPLDETFDIYLNYMIKEKFISIKERDLILKKWFAYSLKKLPAAQYSDKYNYILDKLRTK